MPLRCARAIKSSSIHVEPCSSEGTDPIHRNGEKGVSGNQKAANYELIVDLAQHYFVKANLTAIRRVRKTDNNRIARAVAATIVNRVEDIRESDVGVGCGLFHIEKIGDEWFPL